MFDTSTLKGMKLPDLQEIAKVANIQKFKTLKKDELISQILDLQNSSEAQPQVSMSVNKTTPMSTVNQVAIEETNTKNVSATVEQVCKKFPKCFQRAFKKLPKTFKHNNE